MPKPPLHSFRICHTIRPPASLIPLYFLHEGFGRGVERVEYRPDFPEVLYAFPKHPVDYLSPFLKFLLHAAVRYANRLGHLLQRYAVVLGDVPVVLRIPCKDLVHDGRLALVVKPYDFNERVYPPDIVPAALESLEEYYHIQVLHKVRRQAYGLGRQPVYELVEILGVYRGKARMADCHLLEQHISFLAPDLAYDYVIRPLSQRLLEKLEHVHLRPVLGNRDPRHFRHPVRVREPQFGSVFYAHYLHLRLDEKRQDVEERRLACCRPARYKEALAVFYQHPAISEYGRIRCPVFYQVHGRQRLFGEHSDGEVAPSARYVAGQGGLHSGSVGQRAVEERVGY